jgi:hypothetical protein
VRTEITDIEALRDHRAAGHDLRDTVLIGLDLTGHGDLLRTALDGAVLLGCEVPDRTRRQARRPER